MGKIESDKDMQGIIDDIASLKPEIRKLIIKDKLRNSALDSEIESGDADRQLENSAYLLKKAVESYSYLLESDYNLYIYIVARSIYDDVPMPYVN